MTVAWTLQVIDAICKERQLNRPSVSYGAENLYMHGPLEELTRHNLAKVQTLLCLLCLSAQDVA